MTRTPSQTVGPYYAIGLSREVQNELVDPRDPAAVRLIGQLIDGQYSPIDDGLIEIWDPAGRSARVSAPHATSRWPWIGTQVLSVAPPCCT